MKKILTILSLLLFYSYINAFAADFSFGEIKTTDLLMTRYVADSNAHALVLNEFGKSMITVGADRIELLHDYHVKIKLFDSHAFDDQGNIVIPIYKEDSQRFEEVRDVTAATTYIDDSGIVHTVELDKSKIFTISENKYYNLVKFALPALRKGCVIEYKYTLISPFFFNYKKWDFQSDIPKLHSEYNAHIPGIYNYNIVLRGALKVTKTSAELERDCFTQGGTKCDCSNLTYIMDNVPAFVKEDYMTAEKNFISAVYFELSDYQSLVNGQKIKVTKEWRDIDYSLKSSEFFGSQIKRAGLMKDRIKDVVAGKADTLLKAKALYQYVQKNIKWNSFFSKYSEDGIRKALDTHSGTIGDINLTLIAALNAAGINADAVLLSSREHGMLSKLYPSESDFDYVIARTAISGKVYLLDATDPLLGFGMLPLRCINDQGRVLSMTKASYWIDVAEPQRKIATATLNLTLQANGKLKGMYSKFSYGYEAYEKRKAIKKFNTVDEYVENLDEKSARLKILTSAISNLDSLDLPLTEQYEIEINAGNLASKDKIALNPFLFNRTTVNPFKLAERSYPVDMGMPSDSRYILTLHMPDDYLVENSPQNIGISLPNGGGSIVSNFINDETGCTFSQVVKFSKPVYAAEEYPYLKEIYNKLILSQKTEIIFKKKGS